MSWTLNSTGGDLVGHSGEKFAIVFRGSPSLPFILNNELELLRIHRKRCRRTKAVKKSLMRLGKLTEKTTNDTSLAERENVSVAPRNEVTMKGVVTCARVETVFRVLLGVGECGVTFALTQRRDLEDACQLTYQDHMFQLLMIDISSSREKARYFLVALCQTIHQKKSTPSCPENAKQLS